MFPFDDVVRRLILHTVKHFHLQKPLIPKRAIGLVSQPYASRRSVILFLQISYFFRYENKYMLLGTFSVVFTYRVANDT